jgi:hypothetical protein
MQVTYLLLNLTTTDLESHSARDSWNFANPLGYLEPHKWFHMDSIEKWDVSSSKE